MAELVDAFSLLKISNSPVLTQFLHDCVDDLSGIREVNFNNYNSDIEWTIDDFNRAKKSIQMFYRQRVRDGYELEASELGTNVLDEIKNCFKIRKSDIYECLVKEHLIKGGHNLVANFDWKLKWILGSSKLASIREPILQINLHCLRKDGDEDEARNKINFEVDLRKLDELISQLEMVQNDIKAE